MSGAAYDWCLTPPPVLNDSNCTGCIKSELLDLVEKHRRDGSSLVHQLKDLKDLRKKLEKQKIDIENQLRVPKSGPTPEAKTITFVKEIERAKEYLEFKGCLKEMLFMTHDSVVLEVFENLVKEQKVQESFKELEFQDIMDAVNENIVDLQIERDRNYRELNGIAGGARIPNPIIDLVYRIHEEGYVMDQDPLVELNILKKKHPVFYINCFKARLVDKYLEKEVIVKGIPMEYDEEKIRASLSACGDIEHVKMESWNSWSNEARVTFCSAEAAKLAPFLKKDVCFTISPSPKPEECQAETSTDSIEEYIMAKRKYDGLRNLVKNLSKQNRHRRQRVKKKILKASTSEGQPIPEMPNSIIS